MQQGQWAGNSLPLPADLAGLSEWELCRFQDEDGETTMKRLIAKLTKNEKGATAIEYGLIAALIAVMLITALGTLGNNMRGQFGNISNRIATPSR